MPVFYIGRVAKQTALSVHAIRFYEREGLLLTPVRSEGRFVSSARTTWVT